MALKGYDVSSGSGRYRKLATGKDKEKCAV
jgi:hypothetical protein